MIKCELLKFYVVTLEEINKKSWDLHFIINLNLQLGLKIV